MALIPTIPEVPPFDKAKIIPAPPRKVDLPLMVDMVRSYLSDYDIARAADAAGISVESAKIILTKSKAILGGLKITDVEKAVLKREVIKTLYNIMESSSNSNKDRLRAVDLLGKYLLMWSENTINANGAAVQAGNINITFNEVTKDREIKQTPVEVVNEPEVEVVTVEEINGEA